ncbi:hypothetical protein ACTFIR_009368 [Dictyostelium discoideum]
MDFFDPFIYRHNAEYILSGNNFKISRHIGSQYFHFIQRLSQCLHGFGIKDFKTYRRKVFRSNRWYCTNFVFSGFKTINQSEEHQYFSFLYEAINFLNSSHSYASLLMVLREEIIDICYLKEDIFRKVNIIDKETIKPSLENITIPNTVVITL